MRKGQTHGHMHRKAGVRWPMLALMEWYQLHNSPESQSIYYIQQEKEGLASFGGWSLAGKFSGCKQQARGSCHHDFSRLKEGFVHSYGSVRSILADK